MPINIAITFFIGTILGWIVVKILRPPCHLEGLIITNCSAGNLGNLLLMIIPTLCSEEGSPFAYQSTCSVRGLSYVSMYMALGGIYIWTHTYSLMKRDSITYEGMKKEGLPKMISEEKSNPCLEDRPGNYIESGEESSEDGAGVLPLAKTTDEVPNQTIMEPPLSGGKLNSNEPFYKKVMEIVHLLAKELIEPLAIAAMIGFVVGATP